MLSLKNLGHFGLVVVALLSFGRQSSAQTISCSSDDGRRHYCAADIRGEVRMVKQNSDSPCQQGYSWGFDRGGIWVDRGCRADFAVVPYVYGGIRPKQHYLVLFRRRQPPLLPNEWARSGAVSETA